MEDFNSGRFSTVSEAIRSMMSKEGDFSASRRLQYVDAAKEVFEDLNLSVIKDIKRVVIKLNQHLPVLPVPEDYFDFATMDYVDLHGKFKPLVFNDELHEDVPDISLAHDCGCECGCKSALCCSVKNYEVIQEVVSAQMPDESFQTFTKYTRKYMNKDGSFFQETAEPVRVFEEGEWTDTRLEVATDFICKLEVKECGCLVETPKVLSQLEANCCSLNFKHESGCSHPDFYTCKKSTYSINKDGNRLILPDHFAYDKIVLRYYTTVKTKDILIPRIGLRSFTTGIRKEIALWDKKATAGELAKWENAHTKATTVFRSRLNRMSLFDFYEYYYGEKQTNFRGDTDLDEQYWDNGRYNDDL